MILTTARLALEPLGMKYFERTHLYSSDVENCRYMFWLPREADGKIGSQRNWGQSVCTN